MAKLYCFSPFYVPLSYLSLNNGCVYVLGEGVQDYKSQRAVQEAAFHFQPGFFFRRISVWRALMETLRSPSAVCDVVMAHMKQSPCSRAEIVRLTFAGCEGT